MSVMNAPTRNTLPVQPSGRAGGQRGQTLVIFALFLVVLLGAAALTIDYASWLKARRDYQNGADAAALAGAQFLTRPISDPKRQEARDAAWASLKRQLGLSAGFVTTGKSDTPAVSPLPDSGYRIWVSTPPIGLGSTTAAKYPGASKGPTDNTIFVWVERDNPSYFGNVFGLGSRVVSAWATAGPLPGRFAVITLRKNGQASNGNPQDIQIAGGTTLKVVDGDLGGNWGMAIGGSGAYMQFTSTTTDSYGPYFAEPVSGQTPGNGWNANQVKDGSNNPIPVNYFPEVPDPNYPLPAAIANAPAGAVSPQVPTGDLGGSVSVTGGSVPGGTTGGNGNVPETCLPGSPSIGPGYYTSISVATGKCLILDPTKRHTSVTGGDSPTDLLANQLPGIFYVNGPIDVNNGAMIVADGVTVIMRPDPNNQNQKQLTLSGGNNSPAIMDLNASKRLGAWMTSGTSPYICAITGATESCTYNPSSPSLEADVANVGVALYVVKRIQYNSGAAADDNSSIIKVNASSGLAWQGVTYAPHDNVTLAGQPGHTAVGQLVSWTVKFDGQTTIQQTYAGPENGVGYLFEPHIGQ